MAIVITRKNPHSFSWKGRGTLTPQRLKIVVGTDKIMVMEAKNFITMFRLFEIMEAKVSDIFMRMLEYISTISMACLFSIITSSSKSSSSS